MAGSPYLTLAQAVTLVRERAGGGHNEDDSVLWIALRREEIGFEAKLKPPLATMAGMYRERPNLNAGARSNLRREEWRFFKSYSVFQNERGNASADLRFLSADIDRIWPPSETQDLEIPPFRGNGGPGQPSSKDLVSLLLERRWSRGELEDTIGNEASEIAKIVNEQGAAAGWPHIKSRSCEAHIREWYRAKGAASYPPRRTG